MLKNFLTTENPNIIIPTKYQLNKLLHEKEIEYENSINKKISTSNFISFSLDGWCYQNYNILGVTVRYFDVKDFKIETRIYDIIKCENFKIKILFDHFSNIIEKNNIPLSKIVSISTDNCNSFLSFMRMVDFSKKELVLSAIKKAQEETTTSSKF